MYYAVFHKIGGLVWVTETKDEEQRKKSSPFNQARSGLETAAFQLLAHRYSTKVPNISRITQDLHSTERRVIRRVLDLEQGALVKISAGRIRLRPC
jgi:hypothetical protein